MGGSGPFLLGVLFVDVRPVEDLFVGEAVACEHLEGGAGEIEGVSTRYFGERLFGALRVDALMTFVDDEKIELGC